MSKFSYDERRQIKSIVANLSITRLPDKEIIKEIEKQTDKTITTRYLSEVTQQIKKD